MNELSFDFCVKSVSGFVAEHCLISILDVFLESHQGFTSGLNFAGVVVGRHVSTSIIIVIVPKQSNFELIIINDVFEFEAQTSRRDHRSATGQKHQTPQDPPR